MTSDVESPPREIQNVPLFAGLLIFTLIVAASATFGGQKQAMAALIGGLAGFALYHASFGFTAAWRRVFAERRGVGLRYQFLLIILTCAVSFPLIAYTSAQGNVLPVGIGMLFGSFLFGYGMQFGGGCGSGTLFVAGGGSTRMMVTLAFFVIGSLIGTAHVPFWSAVAFPEFVQSATGVGDRFSYGMINRLGPVTAFIVLALILGAVALFTVWLEKRSHGTLEAPRKTGSLIHGPWSPLAGAVALAIVGILTLFVVGRPWGVTFGFALWGAKIGETLGLDVLSWPYWTVGWRTALVENSVFAHSTSVMNFSIMAGALIAACLATRFKPVWSLSRIDVATAVFGGLLMGYGARLAYGCNIGAYLGGLVSGSAHGWAWAVMAFAGSSLAVVTKRRFGI